ncbi:MAG: hypothetical protein AAFV25_09955, partial [Bacteroidota bacterium]
QVRPLQNNGRQHSTRYMDDADYIRLKNVQLGYTFKGIGGSDASIRVFVAGSNLLTFTDFRGLDPEASFRGADSYRGGEVFFSRPQSRRITFGFNATL